MRKVVKEKSQNIPRKLGVPNVSAFHLISAKREKCKKNCVNTTKYTETMENDESIFNTLGTQFLPQTKYRDKID